MTNADGIESTIASLVATLVEKYAPERIILFGSAASDEASAESDIDLAILKETDLSFYDRLREVACLCEWHAAVDVLVYTPAEFEALSRDNAFVREEILGKGKILYDRAA